MNYIKEINAFYDLQEQVPLSGSGIALWYALMHINNKTRWKNTFTSPGSVLQNKAGISESSFKRARTELRELGYIEVESQGRGKAPVYKMRSLVVEWESDDKSSVVDNQREEVVGSHEMGNPQLSQGLDQAATHQVDERVTHVPAQLVDHLPVDTSAPLVKQYKNKTKPKQNNKHTAAAGMRAVYLPNEKTNPSASEANLDVVRFYQENFGMASPFVAESLLDWIDTLGEVLVMEAMKRALERNKTSWSYVKSILNAWEKKGIRTVEQVEAERVQFENNRRRKTGNGRGGSFHVREDLVPDWYEGEKRRREERLRKEEEEEKEVTVGDVEVAMRRVLGEG